MMPHEIATKLICRNIDKMRDDESVLNAELQRIEENFGGVANMLAIRVIYMFGVEILSYIDENSWKAEKVDINIAGDYINLISNEVELPVSKHHYPELHALLEENLNLFGETYLTWCSRQKLWMSSGEAKVFDLEQREKKLELATAFVRDFFARPEHYIPEGAVREEHCLEGTFYCWDGVYGGFRLRLRAPTDVIYMDVLTEDGVLCSFCVWSLRHQELNGPLSRFLDHVGYESDCIGYSHRDAFLANYPEERTAADNARIENDTGLRKLKRTFMNGHIDIVEMRLAAAVRLTPFASREHEHIESLKQAVLSTIPTPPAPTQRRPKSAGDPTWIVVLEYSFAIVAISALAGKMFGWF